MNHSKFLHEEQVLVGENGRQKETSSRIRRNFSTDLFSLLVD